MVQSKWIHVAGSNVKHGEKRWWGREYGTHPTNSEHDGLASQGYGVVQEVVRHECLEEAWLDKEWCSKFQGTSFLNEEGKRVGSTGWRFSWSAYNEKHGVMTLMRPRHSPTLTPDNLVNFDCFLTPTFCFNSFVWYGGCCLFYTLKCVGKCLLFWFLDGLQYNRGSKVKELSTPFNPWLVSCLSLDESVSLLQGLSFSYGRLYN